MLLCSDVRTWTRRNKYVKIVVGGILSFLPTPWRRDVTLCYVFHEILVNYETNDKTLKDYITAIDFIDISLDIPFLNCSKCHEHAIEFATLNSALKAENVQHLKYSHHHHLCLQFTCSWAST